MQTKPVKQTTRRIELPMMTNMLRSMNSDGGPISSAVIGKEEIGVDNIISCKNVKVNVGRGLEHKASMNSDDSPISSAVIGKADIDLDSIISCKHVKINVGRVLEHKALRKILIKDIIENIV